MNTEEFLEQHNHAPYSLEKVARILDEEEFDDVDIRRAAQEYLTSGDRLEKFLERIGFEFG